jgi:hypothetical protein
MIHVKKPFSPNRRSRLTRPGFHPGPVINCNKFAIEYIISSISFLLRFPKEARIIRWYGLYYPHQNPIQIIKNKFAIEYIISSISFLLRFPKEALALLWSCLPPPGNPIQIIKNKFIIDYISITLFLRFLFC